MTSSMKDFQCFQGIWPQASMSQDTHCHSAAPWGHFNIFQNKAWGPGYWWHGKNNSGNLHGLHESHQIPPFLQELLWLYNCCTPSRIHKVLDCNCNCQQVFSPSNSAHFLACFGRHWIHFTALCLGSKLVRKLCHAKEVSTVSKLARIIQASCESAGLCHVNL